MLASDESRTVTFAGHQPVALNITVGRLIMAEEKGHAVTMESGLVGQMMMDPIILAKSGWAIYEDRFTAAGIKTPEDFYELLDDEGNKNLLNAFTNSVKSFFQWGPACVDQMTTLVNELGEKMKASVEAEQEKQRMTGGE